MKQICRTCAVERKIKRKKEWSAIGICPICQERHILFTVDSNTPAVDLAIALGEKYPKLSPEDTAYYIGEAVND